MCFHPFPGGIADWVTIRGYVAWKIYFRHCFRSIEFIFLKNLTQPCEINEIPVKIRHLTKHPHKPRHFILRLAFQVFAFSSFMLTRKINTFPCSHPTQIESEYV